MGGFFTYEEFWEIYKILYSQFSDLISEPTKIGHTTLKEPIYTFKIGKDIDNLKRVPKSSILFTSLHHSREPITLSMLVAILIQYVRILKHPPKNYTQFDQIDIQFVPVVNIDSYKMINKAWGTQSWAKTRFLRKNR
jgi:carboxypeptidase T